MEYKFGNPDKYGDFPHVTLNSDKEPEKFLDLLNERLPDEYPMQIVCPVEERVLADLSTLGIDSYLEAMTLTKSDRIENRMVGDIVFQKHHAFEFDKTGMICLIRRLKEYNPGQFDHSDCNFGHSNYDWDNSIEEEYRDHPLHDFWSASYQLRSAILSTLQIEDYATI